MTHVMVDLETWGTRPGSAIRSIGAVVFDPQTGNIGSQFYANIEDASCADVGLVRDPRTEAWWSEQSLAAKAAFQSPEAIHVADAVAGFNSWWAEVGGKFVYGHGANFDPVLLEAVFEACMLQAPWDFWNVRCCRTILAMANRKPARAGGTHHNALDDAIAQAKAVAAAFRTQQFSPR